MGVSVNTSTLSNSTDNLELRILSGRHAGASVPLSDGMMLGRDDNADIILTDIALEQSGSYVRRTEEGTWGIVLPNKQKLSNEASGSEMNWERIREIPPGKVIGLGGLIICMSPQDAPWQKTTDLFLDLDQEEAQEESSENENENETKNDFLETEENSELEDFLNPSEDEKQEDIPIDSYESNDSKKPIAILLVASGMVVLAAASWMYWSPITQLFGFKQKTSPTSKELIQNNPLIPSLPQKTPAQKAPKVQPTYQKLGTLTVEQLNVMQKIQKVLEAATQDTQDIKLEISIDAEGPLVSGWIPKTQQFDQIAEAISQIQPPPALHAKILEELQYEVINALAETDGPKLELQIVSSKELAITGLALSEEDKNKKFALIRTAIPKDVPLINEISLASKEAVPSFSANMQRMGLQNFEVRWKGEQLVADLSIEESSVQNFERNLVAWYSRSLGVPFQVKARITPNPMIDSRIKVESPLSKPKAVNAPIDSIPIAMLDLPFKIRSVVSGAMPYIVIDDGSRLFVGGERDGWRLSLIDRSFIILDGPKRITAMR